MNMDAWVLGQSRALGGWLQVIGNQYLAASDVMRWNPFLAPLSEPFQNCGRFFLEKGKPVPEPEWLTPNEIVYRGHKVALRKFNRQTKGKPLLIVPPEAGHSSLIVDYGPEQSLVQCALANHDGDVYVVDKLPAELRHREYCLDDCIRSLKACTDHIGEPVHLVGLCQGGWQSAIFTALFPLEVQSLVLAAAPIDFHAGDGQITEWAAVLPMSFYESLVAMGNDNMPGYFIVFGFMMLNALDRFVGDDLNLLKNVNDPKSMRRYHRFKNWYHWTQPVPGRMYLQIVKMLFKENRLVTNELRVLDRKVDLSRINQPLTLIAGSKDDITPPAQLFAISEHVDSLSIKELTAPAGHIGVFMAKEVISRYWADIFQRLDKQPQFFLMDDAVKMMSGRKFEPGGGDSRIRLP